MKPPLRTAFFVTVLLVHALFFSEWVFFATKSSFLASLAWPSRLVVLAVVSFPFVAIFGAAFGALALLARLAKSDAVTRAVRSVWLVVPACLGAVLTLLLADNFTHTVMGFGSSTVGTIGRVGYGAFIVGSAMYIYTQLHGVRFHSLLQRSTIVLCVVSALAFAWINRGGGSVEGSSIAAAPLDRQPNILVVSGDGMNAERTSAYGYERATTPNLESLLQESLVCANAFTNSANTLGSMTSMLTGRHPVVNQVTFPPQQLKGDNQYRHLPGMLRDRGYRTGYFGIEHFSSPRAMGLREGFHVVNGLSSDLTQAPAVLSKRLGEEPALFLEEVWNRILERFGHVFAGRGGASAFEEATAPKMKDSDAARVDQMLQFIDSVDGPFYAQIHLMVSHGPRYPVTEQVFSQGQEQDAAFLEDFYDDALLQVDTALGKIQDHLRETGVYDDTVVVFWSDHGRNWSTANRLPMLIRFDTKTPARLVHDNVQVSDIAPTLLDYLGVDVPTWMTGASILRGIEPNRPIFATRANRQALGKGLRKPEMQDPSKWLTAVGVISDNRSYLRWFKKGNLATKIIEGHSRPVEDELSKAQVRDLVYGHLTEAGYDTTLIGKTFAPVKDSRSRRRGGK